jgi:putative endonuclease
LNIAKAVLLPHVNRLTLGKRYENIALSYLQKAGLELIERNVCYPVGELDLIMSDRQTIVFVEVRFRRSDAFGGAIQSVTLKKQRRLLKAASHWLMAQNRSLEDTDCRFDIFAITGNEVEWIENAFNLDDICN